MTEDCQIERADEDVTAQERESIVETVTVGGICHERENGVHFQKKNVRLLANERWYVEDSIVEKIKRKDLS